eukprot:TRINITY_DN17349_c0_g1_i1.p1 TRINITY_DN17349_c0_g1~~TRINITY_DN17349_c0_g1_i1.p1  ORF type:complete len:478 (-),score=105.48 TRINITY_DN17349_c0_g1_i1:279-1712(-)
MGLREEGTLRIACCGIHEAGHLTPVIHIAKALVQRGHQVQVVTLEFAKKFEKKVTAFGAEFVSLPSKVTYEDLEEQTHAKGRDPFKPCLDLMIEPLRRHFMEQRPDVIVTDVVTLAPMVLSEELGIPLVMNVPLPMSLFRNLITAPDLSRPVFLFFGIVAHSTPVSPIFFAEKANFAGIQDWVPIVRRHTARSLVAINTFSPLEKTGLLPPCVALTGPLENSEQAAVLPADQQDLHAFLAKAEKVIYVTTGSMVILRPWIVETLFHGLRQVGCSVIWSLKEEAQEHLPEKKDPAFYISSWLPQPALLQHPKVVAVVTHCGWGGVLECINGGKPMLPLPFFGDQPMNADIVVQAGMGEMLAGPSAGGLRLSLGKKGFYKPYEFSAETVEASVRKVLSDDRYWQKARQLQQLSREGGGAEQLVLRIENAARNGVAHLHDEKLYDYLLTGKPPTVLRVAAALLAVAGAAGFLKMIASRRS